MRDVLTFVRDIVRHDDLAGVRHAPDRQPKAALLVQYPHKLLIEVGHTWVSCAKKQNTQAANQKLSNLLVCLHKLSVLGEVLGLPAWSVKAACVPHHVIASCRGQVKGVRGLRLQGLR